MQKSLNPESARSLIQKVQALRKEGKTLGEATKEVGTSVHVYGYWKQKVGGSPKKRAYRKRQIQVLQSPAPHIVAQFVLFSDGNIANLADLKRSA